MEILEIKFVEFVFVIDYFTVLLSPLDLNAFIFSTK